MDNKLKHDILAVVSMGVMVKRRALDMLHPSGKYIEKCVSEMYATSSSGVRRIESSGSARRPVQN